VRTDPVSKFGVQGVSGAGGIKYSINDDTKASEGSFKTANALGGTSGQFGATDAAQFTRSGDALKAVKKNPATSADLPFVQRPELTQPGGDIGSQQQALQSLMK
jgi:hypothetical protein